MSSLERAECVCEPRNSPGKLRKGNESDRADRGCQGLVLALKHVEYRLFNPLVEVYANSSRVCVSGCRVCQSLMKSVPPSQVSFGRGVGEEGVGGRSSGVKDNRMRRAACVHYTVTLHSRFLSLCFFLLSP